MKAMVRISTIMILIFLTLMNIAGCFGGLPKSGNSSDGDVNSSDASGYVLVDTGQVVCFEHNDGHVICTCSR